MQGEPNICKAAPAPWVEIGAKPGEHGQIYKGLGEVPSSERLVSAQRVSDKLRHPNPGAPILTRCPALGSASFQSTSRQALAYLPRAELSEAPSP